MTLQEKYDLLMEKIADKTLSFWCLVLIEHNTRVQLIETDYKQYEIFWRSKEWWQRFWKKEKIIWHPITIWRAIQWWHDSKKQMFTDTDEVQNIWLWFIQELFEKRPKNKLDKPIEPTEDFERVIDFLLPFC